LFKDKAEIYLLDYIEKPYSSLMAKQTSIEQDGTILKAPIQRHVHVELETVTS
jgi:hypothetical protein